MRLVSSHCCIHCFVHSFFFFLIMKWVMLRQNFGVDERMRVLPNSKTTDKFAWIQESKLHLVLSSSQKEILTRDYCRNRLSIVLLAERSYPRLTVNRNFHRASIRPSNLGTIKVPTSVVVGFHPTTPTGFGNKRCNGGQVIG